VPPRRLQGGRRTAAACDAGGRSSVEHDKLIVSGVDSNLGATGIWQNLPDAPRPAAASLKEDTLRHLRPRLTTPLFALLALALVPAAGLAQSAYTYTVGLQAGLGGSIEDQPDVGLDNFGWQALFSMKIDNSTQWGVRVGELALDGGGFDADLRYLTAAGEYLFADRLLDSGLYIGLGFYDLDAFGAGDTALGVVLGVTGDVHLTERFSLLLELSGHYADLDAVQFFAMAHVGLGYRF